MGAEQRKQEVRPSLEPLFRPLRVGSLEVKNRFLMVGLHLGYGEDGFVTQRETDFLVERAKGEVGLIVMGALYTDPLGIWGIGHTGLYDDKFVPRLREMVAAVHGHGAPIFAQLLHAGRDSHSRWIGGQQAVAPSALYCRLTGETPRALSIPQIKQLVEGYTQAAGRAKEAGFDGIEIQGSTGFLVNQFLSPVTNQRDDEYGGDMERRMRFALEIVERIRATVGGDYPIMFRLCGEELVEGGNTLAEARIIAQRLEQAGVDCLDVQTGWHDAPVPTVQMSVPRGAFVPVAQGIKQVVRVPVATCNRITDPALAASILAEGKADLIGMGRAFIADPHLPKKAREGRWEDINTCTACGHCLDMIFTDRETACAVNAQAGREGEYQITPARRPKKVMVVGGGVGGMEAARVAALRGHQVSLYERGDQLGGQVALAAKPPHKEEMLNIIRYLSTQVAKAGVRVVLQKEVAPALVEAEAPEAVIVATGGRPVVPNIPGVDLPQVTTAWDVLAGRSRVGDSPVVIGGGQVGCETAEFLAAQGKKVAILEMLPRMASDMGVTSRWVLLGRLRAAGVRMLTNAKAETITQRGVLIAKNGSQELIEGDTVVLALGARPNNELAQQLQGRVPEVMAVGDAVRPRLVREAIDEGFRAALSL